MSFTPPAPAEEHGERIDRLGAGPAAAVHRVGHAGDRLPQPPLDAAEGDPKALGNLAVREVAEVSKLDQLPLARGQIADRLTDSLAHHRARESSPVGLCLDSVAHALGEHSTEAFVGAPTAPPVDRPLPCAGHEPGTPGAAGGWWNHVVLGCRRGNGHDFDPPYLATPSGPQLPDEVTHELAAEAS